MPEKVGVYICECGPNIKDALKVDLLEEYARGLESVVLSKSVNLLCSREGKRLLIREIKENKLTRVVISGCSPKEHEITFRNVLRDAGLNPFLLQVANIREQCAWVIKDKSVATEKAKAMIRAATTRVLHHQPLEIKEIECKPDVLVVGAGVAGISAALTLAQQNRKIFLIDKSPCIGGKAALYEELSPGLECASCVLEPELDQVLHHDRIEILTCTEVTEALGYYGNFVIKVRQKARFVDVGACIGCGLCFDVCPVSMKNEFNEGLDKRKAIYVPYAGALPNLPVIDNKNCLRFQGESCSACQDVCPCGAVDFEDRDSIRELLVGAVILATGFDFFVPSHASQYGNGKVEDVYTALEFERMLCSNGPTLGKIKLRSGKLPRKIAFIHCVGSRTSRFHEHCSGICCMYLMKLAHQTRKKLPEVSIVELYSDLCLPGKASQSFFNQNSKDDGIEFIRMKAPDSIRVTQKGERIAVRYADIGGNSRTIRSDMVVLAPAMKGAENAGEVAALFGVGQDPSGFLIEWHSNMDPVSTAREGVYIAGCAQGPKDIPSSIAQGQAAASKIMMRLVPGSKLKVEPITAEIDKELCSGCRICLGLCEHGAITCDEVKNRALINDLLCRGCGICAVACPAGAITARHFTDKAVSEEIKCLVG